MCHLSHLFYSDQDRNRWREETESLSWAVVGTRTAHLRLGHRADEGQLGLGRGTVQDRRCRREEEEA
jgi:hypothetical protein